MDQFVLDLKAIPVQSANVPQFATLLCRLASHSNGEMSPEAAIDTACHYLACDRPLRLNVLDNCVSQLVMQCHSGPLVSDLAVKIGGRYSDLLIQENKHSEAAKVLDKILATCERSWKMAPDLLFKLHVQSGKQHLLAHETSLAESAINRAVLARPSSCKEHQAMFDLELAQAQIFDLNGKYLEAAWKWFKVSTDSHSLPQEALTQSRRAMVCAMISPAGASRDELARTILAGPRALSFPVESEILNDLVCKQIVSTHKTNLFTANLCARESSAIVQAINEHNLLILSLQHSKVSLNDLASFLSLEPPRCEEFVAQMILQDRICARIDQVDQMVYFKSALDTRDSPLSYDYSGPEGDHVVLLTRARHMHELSSQLDMLVSRILHKHPFLDVK